MSAGSSIVVDSEIGVTKAKLGNKQAAGPGVVTEVDWIEFVFPKLPMELLERKAEPTGPLITKEMVPSVIIDKLKRRRPFQKLPPINDDISDGYIIFPELREGYLSNMARWNYLVDLHLDVMRQHKKKGYAEVGVDFTDDVKKIFILPQHLGCAS